MTGGYEAGRAASAGDDDAYTVHAEGAKPDGRTGYGHVSAWLILVLPVVLLGAFVVYRVNRRRSRA